MQPFLFYNYYFTCKRFFFMLASKNIWKPSKFRKLPVSEYNKISIKAFWLEALVHQLVTFKKSFRGLETQVSDILYIIFFPIIFGFTLILGPIFLHYDKKKYRELTERMRKKFLITHCLLIFIA